MTLDHRPPALIMNLTLQSGSDLNIRVKPVVVAVVPETSQTLSWQPISIATGPIRDGMGYTSDDGISTQNVYCTPR